jgi:predicted aldo/keto reductase-like oxidoreductase
MLMQENGNSLDRREFLKTTATGLGVAAGSLAISGCKGERGKSEQPSGTTTQPSGTPTTAPAAGTSPDMSYSRLGRTNFKVSRIVSGLGGSAGNDDVWRRELSRGINYFDTALGYGNSEVNIKDFLKEYRDRLWITSKATDIAGYRNIDPDVRKLYLAAMKQFLGDADYAKVEGEPGAGAKEQDRLDLLRFHNAAVARQKATGQKPDLRPAGKKMAELYLAKLDESLGRMGIDVVDSYFMHGVEIPWFFDCHEVWEAYEKAHKAGKVKHFGFSVHNHPKEVLAAAVEANANGPWKMDLIMPGVNPVSIEMLRPELTALKKQDVGIVAMKTKGIENRKVDVNDKRFSELMADRRYNPFERSKLFMLHLSDGLVDAVICQMKNMEEMEKDIPLATVKLSARAKQELRTIVKLEMAGACHLCGDCQTHCPEHIALVDMIRYHAYIHQYDEKEMARELYSLAGYDPAKVCNNCGKCGDVCGSHVPIVDLLHELSRDMA